MTTPIILPWKGVMPKIADDAFIAPGAVIIGDVEIGSKASIWFGCILRGDMNAIKIGERTNVQDGTVIHVDSARPRHGNARIPADGLPTIVGDDVTIGHMVMLHACTVESGAFIGLRSTIMDGVVVEGGAMVAAGALVSPFKRVLRGQLWAGMPAKFMRDLKPGDTEDFVSGVEHYVHFGEDYRAVLGR